MTLSTYKLYRRLNADPVARELANSTHAQWAVIARHASRHGRAFVRLTLDGELS